MARIAVVEDEPMLRMDMVEFLEDCGHTVIGCEQGTHLFEALAHQTVDVFILDINLPGETGFVIAQKLRQSFENTIGIIMLSARSKSTDRVVGLEVGADAYLVKPVDLREVEAQIRAIERRLTPAQPLPAVDPVATSAVWVYNPVDWTLTDPEGQSIKLTASERTFVSHLAIFPILRTDG